MPDVLGVCWVVVLVIIFGRHFAWKARLAQPVRSFTFLEVAATELTFVFLLSATLHSFFQP